MANTSEKGKLETWTNELSERISEQEVNDLTKRISKLSASQIDLLWFRCGFILSDGEFELKALTRSAIKKLKSGKRSAKRLVEALLLETPKQDVEQHLCDLEQELP